jgi:thiamine-phosphate pyrophosphorylase
MSTSKATTEPARLMLVTPPLTEAGDWPARLGEACRIARADALLVRLGPADERTLINIVKAISPPVQALGVAVIIEADVAVAVRGGADGVHVDGDSAALRAAREAMPEGRSVGAGHLRSRHDAMDAGEANVDYVMFGEPRPDGSMPPASAVIERAQWWAEIFQTPCVAYAASPDMVAPLAATGAEFVALGDWLWSEADMPAAITACIAASQVAGRADAPA